MKERIEQYFSNTMLQVVILIGAFIAAYRVPISSLVNTWMTNDDYSYGILIPFISFYLIWEKREQLRKVPVKTFWPVLPLLFLFVLVSLYGVLGSSGHVARPALPVLIFLFAMFCFGIAMTRQILLPLIFFVFMIPLPTILDRTIGVFLKSLSSELGGQMLRLLGYSVHVSGNIIDLGVTQLQVVDACSGLRFLFPLIALGIIYAYYFEKTLWKRILLVLSTIPIAIFSNVLRIAITGVLTYKFGTEMAEGFFHDFEGWVIFMAAFFFLFIFSLLLRLFPSFSVSAKGDNPLNVNGADQRPENMLAVVISLILLTGVGFLTLRTEAMPPIFVKGGIESFPINFGEWRGQRQLVEPEIIEASGAEESFSGYYVNDKNKIVSLYIGYRSSAFLENRNFFHSPTVCLPASGWKTLEQSRYTLHEIPYYQTFDVTEMLVGGPMDSRQLVYFWFQTKDRVTHDKNINRFHLAMHAIKKDNTHDLFIRLMTSIEDDDAIQSSRQRLEDFAREMMPALEQFLKDRQYEGEYNLQ
ncbi:MAG: VPLPA-CTERM-specific exosortase XrtD [Desulfamplus sp.]|nr:VPLPA-CTERM-specific exosortase XrtD [Desulfamplus sp.]